MSERALGWLVLSACVGLASAAHAKSSYTVVKRPTVKIKVDNGKATVMDVGSGQVHLKPRTSAKGRSCVSVRPTPSTRGARPRGSLAAGACELSPR